MNIETIFENEITAELLETEEALETNENETADAVDNDEESHDDDEEIHDDDNGENGDEV
ncbi:MAG: hypothetical protein ACK5FV_12360 [Bacteroidota bacterium]|jgi:hypothetical protein|nr:hypothetical protein [Saprospiraceae bacterium]